MAKTKLNLSDIQRPVDLLCSTIPLYKKGVQIVFIDSRLLKKEKQFNTGPTITVPTSGLWPRSAVGQIWRLKSMRYILLLGGNIENKVVLKIMMR